MRPRVPVVLAVVMTVCVSLVPPAGVVGAATDETTVTVSVDDSSVWVGESVDVAVTVDNAAFRTLEVESVRLVDSTGTVRATERPDADRIEPQGSAQVGLGVTIEDVGVTELTAVVEFAERDEPTPESVTVTARDPTPLVDLTTTQGAVATERTVRVSVGNPHDAPLRRVETSVSGPASVELADTTGIIPTIPPGETRELTFNVSGVEPGRATFDVTLSFATADGRFWTRRVSNTVTFDDPRVRVSPSTAPVRLAGLDVSGTGEVTISGDVANTQSTALTGVLITFPDRIDSTDARFVGSVNGGEFAPFNPVSASVSLNRTTVPLEVSYTLDGTRYTTVFELPLEGVREESTLPKPDPGGSSVDTTSTASDEGGLPVPLIGIGGTAALLALLVGGVVYKRR